MLNEFQILAERLRSQLDTALSILSKEKFMCPCRHSEKESKRRRSLSQKNVS